MNLRLIVARTAVAGVTTALAAGALVGVTGTAANAETGTASYGCTTGFSPGDVLPLTLAASGDLSGFPPFATGFAVPADLVAIQLAVTLSEEAVQGLKDKGIDSVGGGSSDLTFPFGSGKVPISPFEIPSAALPDTGPFTMTADISNAGFKLPNAGKNLPIKMPAAFTLTNLIPGVPFDCTVSGAQPTITTYTVTKQGAGVTGKAPKSVKAKKAFNIVATVAGDNRPATGKVVAKDGKKVIGSGVLKKGKATIKLAKGISKVGTHNITLAYAGDKQTNAAQGGVLVNITK
jgi:hypothetical protein